VLLVVRCKQYENGRSMHSAVRSTRPQNLLVLCVCCTAILRSMVHHNNSGHHEINLAIKTISLRFTRQHRINWQQ
jgi:hypothetical protein